MPRNGCGSPRSWISSRWIDKPKGCGVSTQLFAEDRHEPSPAIPWDEASARDTIARIVQDTEERFSPDMWWPTHPLDDGDAAPMYSLYMGACGVVSARETYGQMRYSLWTGDPGFAIYLWDCIRGSDRFPTLDVFFS